MFAADRHCSLEALSKRARVDMEEHISYLLGLSDLVTQPLRYSEEVVLEFYASLWISLDRSYLLFMYRGKPHWFERSDV